MLGARSGRGHRLAPTARDRGRPCRTRRGHRLRPRSHRSWTSFFSVSPPSCSPSRGASFASVSASEGDRHARPLRRRRDHLAPASSSTCSSRCSSRRRSRELARLRADRSSSSRSVVAAVKPLGALHGPGLRGGARLLEKALGWLERLVYRLAASRATPDEREMRWTTYAVRDAALQRRRASSPSTRSSGCRACSAQPAGCGAVSPDLSWNTAVSFVTNTNWQTYGGETTMSYLTQMSPSRCRTSSARRRAWRSCVALVRGIVAQDDRRRIGNFWVDLTRSTLYILLPLSFVLAVVFVSQGVVQTLSGPTARRAPPGDEGRRRARP